MQQMTRPPMPDQGFAQTRAPEPDDDIIDLRALFQTIWNGKWIIAICGLLALVMAFLAVGQMTPMYTARAKVMFDLAKQNVVNIQEVLVDPEFSKDTLQNEIEVLSSSKLIERVVDKLQLDRDPEFNARLRVAETGLLDRVRESVSIPPELLSLMQDWGIMRAPAAALDPAERARRERLAVIEAVQKGLSLSPVRGSRVIEIAFTSERPQTAANVVNTIAEQYIVDQLEAKLEATRSATEWLSVRVEELRDRVQASENRVEETRAKLALDAGQSLAITRQQLEALSASLASARNQSAQAVALYDRLNEALAAGGDLGAVPEFRDSPLIQRFREQESELIARETSLMASVGPNHPTLLRLRAQLEDVRRNIAEEASRIVAAVRIDMDAATAQEAALAAKVRTLEEKGLEQSKAELQLRQLEREAQASRILYENFLGRLQETSEQESLQSADARVLSPAERPLQPESQRKKVILLLSAIVGAGVGTGIVFLLDKLNNTFRAPGQVEELTGLGVLATIPKGGSRLHRKDVLAQLREKPNGSMAEAVRNLRTSVLFSNVDSPPKVVMFTSSVPREGKSTTSMMMALTSRQMGKSAVIVDCDLRLPALARMLEAGDDRPGLLSVLEGTATIAEAIHHDAETGLHVLMVHPGERPAQINAADILSSQKFRSLIEELADSYDLVILDTPPAVVVSDARIVSRVADAVVYVLRWDDTPRGAVLEGLKELRTVGANVIGVAMTLVNESKAARYSYQGYGYYKGRYKDYYVT